MLIVLVDWFFEVGVWLVCCLGLGFVVSLLVILWFWCVAVGLVCVAFVLCCSGFVSFRGWFVWQFVVIDLR